MRSHLGSTLLALGLLAGCGGATTEPASESPAKQQAPLTATDVDTAPECQGIITFANTASFETLHKYLPSDVTTNLVTRRDTAPFVSLADISSVRLMGSARLQQLEGGARTEGSIGADCVGIRDGVAVSADDDAAMVSLVNSISDSELHDILPDAWNGAVNLLNLRPFSSSLGIANTSGIGSVSFRKLRNAATLSRPFEELAALVQPQPEDDFGSTIARHFDWYNTLWGTTNSRGHWEAECFGMDPQYLPSNTTIRANLADAAEVHDKVASAVLYGTIPSSVIDSGMANLDALAAGHTFKGCYVTYSAVAYSNDRLAFFIDPKTGFSVMTHVYWGE